MVLNASSRRRSHQPLTLNGRSPLILCSEMNSSPVLRDIYEKRYSMRSRLRSQAAATPLIRVIFLLACSSSKVRLRQKFSPSPTSIQKRRRKLSADSQNHTKAADRLLPTFPLLYVALWRNVS